MDEQLYNKYMSIYVNGHAHANLNLNNMWCITARSIHGLWDKRHLI